MMRGIVLIGSLIVAATGCAPISESVRYQDRWIKERTVSDEGAAVTVSTTVRYREDGAQITASSHRTCTEQVEDVFRRTRITERHADPTSMYLLYGLGGLGVGIGALVVVDPNASTTSSSGYSTPMNTVSPSESRATGGVLLGLGAVTLAAGVVTSIRARDEVANLGTVTAVRPGSQRELSCEVKPAAGRDILLTTSSATNVSLGKTDHAGHLDIRWNALKAIFDGGQEPASSGTLAVAHGGTAGKIDLTYARTYWAQQALADAKVLAGLDQVDEAREEVDRAAKLGADTSAVEREIEAAPTSVSRARVAEQRAKAEREAADEAKNKEIDGHLTRARQFIHSNDPTKARGELDAAAALGADVTSLADKVTTIASARAVAQWKKHVAQCRKVSAARSKLESLSSCDAECQQIRRRVDDDWDHLSSEILDLDGLPPNQRSSFLEMCQRAGCPTCPDDAATPFE
ncbi:MAG TPA: hypothetical protein VG944_04605 [Fimbriimonas sp.]|nr:hypothetical protein [Fimbriimonas sp.]